MIVDYIHANTNTSLFLIHTYHVNVVLICIKKIIKAFHQYYSYPAFQYVVEGPHYSRAQDRYPAVNTVALAQCMSR